MVEEKVIEQRSREAVELILGHLKIPNDRERLRTPLLAHAKNACRRKWATGSNAAPASIVRIRVAETAENVFELAAMEAGIPFDCISEIFKPGFSGIDVTTDNPRVV